MEPSITNPDFYKLIRGIGGVPHMKGTCHGEDLPLLFKMDVTRKFDKNDDNYVGQQIFLNSFIEFVRRGNPNCQVLISKIVWEPLPNERSDNVPCMEITRDNGVTQQLSNYDKIKVWNDLYDDKQNLF